MVPIVIVVIDEGTGLGLQEDAVLEGLVPTIDLALCLRMAGSTTDMLQIPFVEPIGQIAGDE